MDHRSPKVEGGFILLARRLFKSGIMGKPPLYMKLWTWMLLMASYKDHSNLKRGQFVTSIEKMRDAMAYKVGFRTVKPTKKEIRSAYDFLAKGNMIGTTKVTHGMIITIVNYDYYQDWRNYEGHNEGNNEGTGRGTIYNKEREKKGNKPPDDISTEISSLQSKYTSDLLHQVFKAVSSTRVSNHIADSVRLKILQSWEKYPVHQVESGIRIYLEKDYASKDNDKNEKYLFGIIRSQNGETECIGQKEADPLTRRATGSILDEHYRAQGYRIIP